MSFFQRYLTLWVLICMALGVALGHFLPALPRFLGAPADRWHFSSHGSAHLDHDLPHDD